MLQVRFSPSTEATLIKAANLSSAIFAILGCIFIGVMEPGQLSKEGTFLLVGCFLPCFGTSLLSGLGREGSAKTLKMKVQGILLILLIFAMVPLLVWVIY
jgi:hypothetical protein